MKIVNINDKWGDPVTFEASDLDHAVAYMAYSIKACGYMTDMTVDELADTLVDGVDYEVTE